MADISSEAHEAEVGVDSVGVAHAAAGEEDGECSSQEFAATRAVTEGRFDSAIVVSMRSEAHFSAGAAEAATSKGESARSYLNTIDTGIGSGQGSTATATATAAASEELESLSSAVMATAAASSPVAAAGLVSAVVSPIPAADVVKGCVGDDGTATEHGRGNEREQKGAGREEDARDESRAEEVAAESAEDADTGKDGAGERREPRSERGATEVRTPNVSESKESITAKQDPSDASPSLSSLPLGFGLLSRGLSGVRGAVELQMSRESAQEVMRGAEKLQENTKVALSGFLAAISDKSQMEKRMAAISSSEVVKSVSSFKLTAPSSTFTLPSSASVSAASAGAGIQSLWRQISTSASSTVTPGSSGQESRDSSTSKSTRNCDSNDSMKSILKPETLSSEQEGLSGRKRREEAGGGREDKEQGTVLDGQEKREEGTGSEGEMYVAAGQGKGNVEGDSKARGGIDGEDAKCSVETIEEDSLEAQVEEGCLCSEALTRSKQTASSAKQGPASDLDTTAPLATGSAAAAAAAVTTEPAAAAAAAAAPVAAGSANSAIATASSSADGVSVKADLSSPAASAISSFASSGTDGSPKPKATNPQGATTEAHKLQGTTPPAGKTSPSVGILPTASAIDSLTHGFIESSKTAAFGLLDGSKIAAADLLDGSKSAAITLLDGSKTAAVGLMDGSKTAAIGFIDGSRNVARVIQRRARQMATQNKRRHQSDNFDLDLSYITDNIIAMGMPAGSGLTGLVESMYRDHMSDVVQFLDTYHKGNYMIFNLSAENPYDPSIFHGKVRSFLIDEGSVPNLPVVRVFCKTAADWLKPSTKMGQRGTAKVEEEVLEQQGSGGSGGGSGGKRETEGEDGIGAAEREDESSTAGGEEALESSQETVIRRSEGCGSDEGGGSQGGEAKRLDGEPVGIQENEIGEAERVEEGASETLEKVGQTEQAESEAAGAGAAAAAGAAAGAGAEAAAGGVEDCAVDDAQCAGESATGEETKEKLLKAMVEDRWRERVIVVHCSDGVQRTGLMVSCLLLYLKQFSSASEAIDFFTTKRCLQGQAITMPSYRRYVGYFETLLKSPLDAPLPPPRRCFVRGFRLHKCPYWIRPSVTISSHKMVVFSSKRHPRTKDFVPDDFWQPSQRKGSVIFALPGPRGLAEVWGSFNVRFQDKHGEFSCWLNTSMMPDRLLLPISEFDHWDKHRAPAPGLVVEIVIIDHDAPMPVKKKTKELPSSDSSGKKSLKAAAGSGAKDPIASFSRTLSESSSSLMKTTSTTATSAASGAMSMASSALQRFRASMATGSGIVEEEEGRKGSEATKASGQREDDDNVHPDIFSDSDDDDEHDEEGGVAVGGKQQGAAAKSGMREKQAPEPGTPAAALALFSSALTSSVQDIKSVGGSLGHNLTRGLMRITKTGDDGAGVKGATKSTAAAAAAAVPAPPSQAARAVSTGGVSGSDGASLESALRAASAVTNAGSAAVASSKAAASSLSSQATGSSAADMASAFSDHNVVQDGAKPPATTVASSSASAAASAIPQHPVHLTPPISSLPATIPLPAATTAPPATIVPPLPPSVPQTDALLSPSSDFVLAAAAAADASVFTFDDDDDFDDFE